MGEWGIIPTIRVPDMAEAVEFYRDTLGFVLDREDGYSEANNSMSRGDAHLMLETPGEHFGPSYNEAIRQRMGSLSPTTLYMETDDIEELYARLGDLGISIVDPLMERPWNLREFTIEDHLGNWLTFWKRD